MKDKYVWWGLLGIGVAAFFYFLSSQNKSGSGTVSNIQVPYLVPSTGASPSASQSLSTQPNIVGSSNNSTIPNFSNPYMVSANPFEAPNTWGFMPNLQVSQPTGPNNAVGLPFTSPTNHWFEQNGVSVVQSPPHF